MMLNYKRVRRHRHNALLGCRQPFRRCVLTTAGTGSGQGVEPRSNAYDFLEI